MCFVQHNDRVPLQVRIQKDFTLEHTICNVFDICGRAGTVIESNRIADFLAQDTADFFSKALSHRYTSYTTRLRASENTAVCETRLGQILCDLCRLARACFTDDDEDLMLPYTANQLGTEGEDWKRFSLLFDRHVGPLSEGLVF